MSKNKVTCIICPKGCEIEVEVVGSEIKSVKGQECVRGLQYASNECISPKRFFTSLISVKGGKYPVTSIKTTKPIPKELIHNLQAMVLNMSVNAPIKKGVIIANNVFETGADVIITKSIET